MNEPKVSGWVIYRLVVGGEPEFYGILKDRQSAHNELEILNGLATGGGWESKGSDASWLGDFSE